MLALVSNERIIILRFYRKIRSFSSLQIVLLFNRNIRLSIYTLDRNERGQRGNNELKCLSIKLKACARF